MPEPVLEAVDLSYIYPDGTVALENLSVVIPTGSRVALLGPNGAGKTTLFLLLAGMLRPAGGRVRFCGQDLDYSRHSLARLRRRVGLVFQDPEAQIFAPTVWEEVAFGPANQGLSREAVAERVEAALAATRLLEVRDRATHFLSYGQKKRLCLAGVLAMEPEVLLLDEPTAGLDPKQTRRVVGILEELSRMGRTLVLATHDVDLAYAWAETVYIFGRGRVLARGTPEEVFADADLLESTSLERPLLLEMFLALQERGLVSPGTAPPREKKGLWRLLPEGGRARWPRG
ncbi:MAG: energy-coupling factor ABC transporter ATP-binding protein [Desulfotomaculales bacterium]